MSEAAKITLYHHGPAPNPVKVAILLEELGIPYNLVHKEFGDGPNGVRNPDFLATNPIGRVPAIIDHSNNKTVWESGAILFYLIDRFDPSGKYGGRNIDEKVVVWEWLMFELSGKGPTLGQLYYFKHLHPVKNLDQSVYDRFINEMHRFYGILEKRLQGREFIAINRFTIADMGFYSLLRAAIYSDLAFEEYPLLSAYVKRLEEFPSVKAVFSKLAV